MKSALRSFTAATLIVLMGFSLTWLYFRSKAASQAPPKPLTTTFFDVGSKPLVFAKVAGLSTEQIKMLKPQIQFWVDTQITKDNKAVILTERELLNPNFSPNSSYRTPETQLKNLSIRYLNLSDVVKAKPEAGLLEDLITDYPEKRFIINVVDYAPGADAILSELISRLKADERIILQSQQEGLLTDLRKLESMWLYGTSRAQIVQTIWLTTIGLQGISPLKGDVLITQLHAETTNQNAVLLTPELMTEARRRSMKVVVGPVTKLEADGLTQLGVDGVITSEPQEFRFP